MSSSVRWFRSDHSAYLTNPASHVDGHTRGGDQVMDTASAIERLANYSKKNSRASRDIFEAGVVIFDDDALLHRLGDDSARLSFPPNGGRLLSAALLPLHCAPS